jgi:hypothetical protein
MSHPKEAVSKLPILATENNERCISLSVMHLTISGTGRCISTVWLFEAPESQF